MIGVEQQVSGGNGRGDCMRACIASILEVPIEELPLITPADGDRWWKDLNEDLRYRYAVQMVEWTPMRRNLYQAATAGEWPVPKFGLWIASVRSLNIAAEDPDDPPLHAVVMRGWQIAWDPSPFVKRKDFEDDNWIYGVTILAALDPAIGINLHGMHCG